MRQSPGGNKVHTCFGQRRNTAERDIPAGFQTRLIAGDPDSLHDLLEQNTDYQRVR